MGEFAVIFFFGQCVQLLLGRGKRVVGREYEANVKFFLGLEV